MANLFQPGNIFWSLVGNATQTLFDGGTLLARRRAAQAGLDQALADYKTTVVGALQNVADTLYALQTDERAMQATMHAEEAAKVSLDLTRKQVASGYVNTLALIAAEATYQQAVLGRLQARGSWLGDTAALFQALGGGWWDVGNPSSASASEPAARGDLARE
jgi:outer membrane protein TolC